MQLFLGKNPRKLALLGGDVKLKAEEKTSRKKIKIVPSYMSIDEFQSKLKNLDLVYRHPRTGDKTTHHKENGRRADVSTLLKEISKNDPPEVKSLVRQASEAPSELTADEMILLHDGKPVILPSSQESQYALRMGSENSEPEMESSMITEPEAGFENVSVAYLYEIPSQKQTITLSSSPSEGKYENENLDTLSRTTEIMEMTQMKAAAFDRTTDHFVIHGSNNELTSNEIEQDTNDNIPQTSVYDVSSDYSSLNTSLDNQHDYIILSSQNGLENSVNKNSHQDETIEDSDTESTIGTGHEEETREHSMENDLSTFSMHQLRQLVARFGVKSSAYKSEMVSILANCLKTSKISLSRCMNSEPEVSRNALFKAITHEITHNSKAQTWWAKILCYEPVSLEKFVQFLSVDLDITFVDRGFIQAWADRTGITLTK